MNFELNLTKEELEKRLSDEAFCKIQLLSFESKEFQELSSREKKVLVHLVRASEFIEKVYFQMENSKNLEIINFLQKEIANGNKNAEMTKILFDAQKSVFSPDYDGNEIVLIKGVKEKVGLNFFPEDLTREEFHQILEKMIKENKECEVQKILSSRTIVKRKENELVGIDIIDFFPEFQNVADELETALSFCDDEVFGDYLSCQILALREANPNYDAIADKLWAKLDKSKFEFTITRESYKDEMTESIFDNKKLCKKLCDMKIDIVSKDLIGARVGIVNFEGTKILEDLKKLSDIAKELMPFQNEYKTNNKNCETKQTAVDVDLITLTGDEGAYQAGIVVAQNLPNGDKLSLKIGGGKRNVYHRQIRTNSDLKVVDLILCEKLVHLYSSEAGHFGTICHENTHSLGPDSGKSLGVYSSILEEFKADMGIYSFLNEFVLKGVFSEEVKKKIVVTNIVESFVKAKPKLSQAHRVRSVMIANKMLESGSVWLDENNKIDMDIEKVIETANEMMKDVIRLQLDKDVEKAKFYVEKYFLWSADVQKVSDIRKQNSKRLNGTIEKPLANLMLLQDFEKSL